MKLIEIVQGRKWYEISANGGIATVWECDYPGCWHAQLGAACEVELSRGTIVEGGELSAQLRALELLGAGQ